MLTIIMLMIIIIRIMVIMVLYIRITITMVLSTKIMLIRIDISNSSNLENLFKHSRDRHLVLVTTPNFVPAHPNQKTVD